MKWTETKRFAFSPDVSAHSRVKLIFYIHNFINIDSFETRQFVIVESNLYASLPFPMCTSLISYFIISIVQLSTFLLHVHHVLS